MEKREQEEVNKDKTGRGLYRSNEGANISKFRLGTCSLKLGEGDVKDV